MKKRERIPPDGERLYNTHKMKMGLRLPLELLQWSSILYFAVAACDAATAVDGLRPCVSIFWVMYRN
jgi:hypothetical protein